MRLENSIVLITRWHYECVISLIERHVKGDLCVMRHETKAVSLCNKLNVQYSVTLLCAGNAKGKGSGKSS